MEVPSREEASVVHMGVAIEDLSLAFEVGRVGKFDESYCRMTQVRARAPMVNISPL